VWGSSPAELAGHPPNYRKHALELQTFLAREGTAFEGTGGEGGLIL